MTLIAALPMYDWPEQRAETDRFWTTLRDRFRERGIDAPERLARCNGDLPPVPGGIRDGEGDVIAPDPATLDPDGFDLQTVWRHPNLFLAQTCWGPMGQGLVRHVLVVGQPDYSPFEGGEGALYSSAILARHDEAAAGSSGIPPADQLRGRRLAFNGRDSMSGLIALTEDLEKAGESLSLFGETIEVGSHRNAIRAVAAGSADLCAIDCRTLDLARRYEPATASLAVIGWTAKRKGLPYVTALAQASLAPVITTILSDIGAITEPASG